MNTSRRGNSKEVATIRLLEADGWLCGSRRHIGGAGDVLAARGKWHGGRYIWLVEVKCTARSPWHGFGRKDRASLVAEAERAEAVPVLAWWAPGAIEHQLIFEDEWP